MKTGRGRQVRRVALGGAGIRPADDRRDLVVAERAVILVVADAHGLVEMPRWHVAVRHSLANRSHPRPHLFIAGQRHGRRRALPMASLALRLEDRRDVLREGYWTRGRLRPLRRVGAPPP